MHKRQKLYYVEIFKLDNKAQFSGNSHWSRERARTARTNHRVSAVTRLTLPREFGPGVKVTFGTGDGDDEGLELVALENFLNRTGTLAMTTGQNDNETGSVLSFVAFDVFPFSAYGSR